MAMAQPADGRTLTPTHVERNPRKENQRITGTIGTTIRSFKILYRTLSDLVTNGELP